MKQRFSIALAATLAAAACFVAVSAAAPVQVTEAGTAKFPDRAYVMTLGSGVRLVASEIAVRENGQPVTGVSVVPASSAKDTSFGTVLAIDTSNSMVGKPIRGAVGAARAFAARRNQNQSLSIVGFNKVTDLVLPFTKSQPLIDRALSRQPALANGTHIFDAAARSIALLQAAGVNSGAVVVLSDGADTGSDISLDTLTLQAREAHVRLFTVGLHSRSFRARDLKRMASETGGSFSNAASPADLATIFDQLGLRLANEYIVRYRSLAKPSTHIRVTITVLGIGKGRADYATPALHLATPHAFHRSILDRIWQSPLTMVAIALLVASLIALGLFSAVRPSGSSVRKRMSDFVSIAKASKGVTRPPLASRIFVGTERSLERTRWWSSFKETLEFAEIEVPAVQIVVGTLVLTLAAMWLLGTVIAGVAAVFGLGVPLIVRTYINFKVEAKRRLFGDQLPDNLDVLASGLRAGHSLVGALAIVVNDAPEPSRTEFQRVVADEQLGVPLEDALGVVVKRMQSRDVEQVALVASLQRETGGNSAEVLERVTENIRERAELRRLVRGLTAQGRLSRWIVSLLPVGLLIVISLLDPGYMRPLFHHTSGKIVLLIAAIMVTSGSLVIRRIVNIKV